MLNEEDDCVLSKKQVLAMVGLSFPTVWKMMREGTFPLSRRLSSSKIGWLRSEVVEWLRSRPVQVYKPVELDRHKKKV